jgi:hypothetical protein
MKQFTLRFCPLTNIDHYQQTSRRLLMLRDDYSSVFTTPTLAAHGTDERIAL